MKTKKSGRHARRTSAAEALVGFIVAVAIFTLALMIVISSVQNYIPSEGSTRDLQSKATQTIDIMLNGPGVPYNWQENPDSGDTQISRFGLTINKSTYLISSEKMNSMSSATLYENSTNGLLDYEEAKAALGLSGYDFHIRMYPIFTGSENAYGTVMMGDTHVGYIGNYGSLTNPPSTLWDLSQTSESAEESNALSELGATFDKDLYILSPLRSGDKFADKSDYLESYLVPRLNSNYYDVLVVGSNVDQTALTPTAIKGAIEAWLKAGGKLIVTGGEQNTNWLQPFLTSGTRGSSGSAYVPDTSHPMLTIPNQLNYASYPDPGRVWVVPTEVYAHVITEGGDKNSMNDLITFGYEGAVDSEGNSIYGDGILFLTTYRPYLIASQINSAEARMFFANMITYVTHHETYLDYGPSIPSGASVSTSERVSSVYFPNLGIIEVHVIVYVWQG